MDSPYDPLAAFSTFTRGELLLAINDWIMRCDIAETDRAELLTALKQIANGEGYYGAQAAEYKAIARAAIAKAEAT